ncbi:hypothetical protein AAVH_31248 [Aphelenchoides avenae]|nr:hypothetical protein AAVH_31248 [Aphelenchus avenae]
MSPRPERKARKDHKVLGEFAGNSLYPPTTRHVLRNKPELVEAAVVEVLSKNRNADIRQSVVLKTVRGELTASTAANQCGVGRSTMNRKLRAVKSKLSMKKTALRCGRGGGRAPKPAPAVPTVNGSNGNGAQGEAGNAVEQAEIGVTAPGANAATAPDQQHVALVDLKRQLAEKEKTIEHQQARILSLEETVAVLQEDLGKKATMITGLRNQLDVLQQGASRVENSVHETNVDQPSQGSGSVEVQDYVQHANPREKYKFDNCSQLGEGTHGKVLRVTLERETAI